MSVFPSAASIDQLPPLLRTLAARGEPRRYRKGTVLIHEGDQGDTLFILLSGRVKVCSMDARGREIVYGVYGPGEYLGEMSLDGGPRSASVITLEAVACVVVARQTLREHIAANPDFAFELLGRVIRRARLATQSTRDLALLDVYGRLVNLFESLAVVREDGTRVLRERMTHQEIASRVGCSREMVSRLMKDLERGGYLTTQGSITTIASRLPAHW
jgi:CRP/FNR family transcriptional regulator, cyclic AMP receptor protein